MVAVSVQPPAVCVCAFGIILVFAVGVHHVWAYVNLAFAVFQSFSFRVAHISADDNLVVQLPSVSIFHRAFFLLAQNVPIGVEKVVCRCCLGNVAPCSQAVFQADIVGVVVKVAHYYEFCIGVQAGNGVFD